MIFINASPTNQDGTPKRAFPSFDLIKMDSDERFLSALPFASIDKDDNLSTINNEIRQTLCC